MLLEDWYFPTNILKKQIIICYPYFLWIFAGYKKANIICSSIPGEWDYSKKHLEKTFENLDIITHRISNPEYELNTEFKIRLFYGIPKAKFVNLFDLRKKAVTLFFLL